MLCVLVCVCVYFGTMRVGGPHEKMSFFQIASGPILSIPIHLKTCLYGPCKFSLKKMTPSLPTNPPKSAFFVTSDWTSDGLVTDPCTALMVNNSYTKHGTPSM